MNKTKVARSRGCRRKVKAWAAKSGRDFSNATMRRNPRGIVTKKKNGLIRESCSSMKELKHAEISALRLAAAVQSSHDAIAAKTLNGIITDWNQSAQRIFGYKPKEIIGKSILTLIPKDRQSEEQEILRKIRRGESLDHYETVRRRKDGRLIDVSLTISPIKGPKGEIIGVSKIARDITKQKQTERRLTEQARLLDLTSDAVIVRDHHDRIVYWNRGAEEMYGFSAKEALGKITHELLRTAHPGDYKSIQKNLKRENRWAGELVHTRKNGKTITAFSRWSLDRDARGRPTLILETNTDVTALRQSQKQLARELEDALLLQQTSAQLIHQDDTQTLYEKILDAAVGIMRSDFASIQMVYRERGHAGHLRLLAYRGYTRESAAAWEWIGADHPTTCGTALRTGKRSTVPDIETCDWLAGTKDLALYRQTGIRSLQSTPLVSRTGRKLGMISTCWKQVHEPSERDVRLLDVLARQAADVIERKQAEAALRQKEAELEQIVTQTPFMLTRCTRDLRYRYVSRAYAEMFGRQPKEMAGKPIVDIIGKEALKTIFPYIQKVLKGKQAQYEIEVPYQGVGAHWLSCVYTPDRDSDGNVVGWFASLIDIGDRKKAETMLQKSKELLEERVRERTSELDLTNKELQAEIKRRKGLEGEILAISDREQQRLGQELHDGLCQHLTAVAFMTRSIALRLRDHRVVDAADIEKVAELVNRAAIDTRSLSRALHRVDVDAAGLIVALQDLVDREIWRTPCRLEAKPSFRIDDDGAASHVYRIAREAVINANKHAQARQIVVRLERVRKEMILRVIDDGIGLPKDVKPQQGLGFHIMNYRAQLMGGRVEIDSPQRGGTCVSCYLPLRAAECNKVANGDRQNGAKPTKSAVPVPRDLTLRHLAWRGAANA
jgi:PAS domain S-box-containing protein